MVLSGGQTVRLLANFPQRAEMKAIFLKTKKLVVFQRLKHNVCMEAELGRFVTGEGGFKKAIKIFSI